MSDVYTKIVEKLEKWGEDSQEVMEDNDSLEVFQDERGEGDVQQQLFTDIYTG